MNSGTFRVFVSSTFSDLKPERDALQAKVFPRLRELCERHGARFQAIDLRWGVSQEASRDQQTMNICLREIARCQEVTPRPNFVVLLGDRYGWCPPPPQIPAHEFDRILEHVSGGGRSLLNEWNRRDDNAVPAKYVLQPWDEYSYEAWRQIERAVHDALENGARAAELAENALFKYWASATHQEIAAGAMSVPDADEHVFAFFRRIDGLPKNEEAEGFIDLIEAGERMKPDADARQRLADLKADLRSTLGEANVEEYEVRWADGGPPTHHIDQLCDDVYQALGGVIERQLAQLEEVDPLEAEVAAHQTFGQERAEFFTGRVEYLCQIADYVEDASPHPLAVWGESGSGKSALLAKAVEEAQEAHPEAQLIYRFIGATPESSSGRALLESLCRQISRCYGADESDIPLEYKDLAQEFPERLALATAEKPLVIFIDALDQLSDADNAKALTWLPAELPGNVRLVVSTVPGACYDVLERKLSQKNRVELDPMPESEAEELLDLWLENAGRQLQPEQRRDVLTNPKPLYLKLAFEEARRWHSYHGLPKGADDVPGLSDDIHGVIRDLFARLSSEANHGQVLVSRSLGYLAAAKNGLTEDELLDVLARDVDVYTWFLRTLFHIPPDLLRRAQEYLEERRAVTVGEEGAEAWLKKLREGKDEKRLRDFLSTVLTHDNGLRLPVVLWSRLYADLEPYLTHRRADGTSLMTFYHPTTFGAAVTKTYLGEDVSESRHRALAGYFSGQALIRGEGEEQQPNLRKLSELPYQQAHGHQWDQVKNSLTDFDFIQAKVSAAGPQPLIDDYNEVDAVGHEDRDLSLVQGALQLSAHILAEDDHQLAGQLAGRLITQDGPAIQCLLKEIRQKKSTPWLRPLRATFTQPGGPLIRTLEGHTSFHRVTVTYDERLVAPASYDDTLRVWDLGAEDEVRIVAGHNKATAVTPDGIRAVSSSANNTLKVWDLASGTEIHSLAGHRSRINAVAVTPDGSIAASAGGSGHQGDNNVRVWDLETGKQLHCLEGHTSEVLALEITPDGERAVSGSKDKTVRVWDIENGHIVHILDGHTNWINVLTVTPNGKRAVSASYDKTLRVWDLDSGEAMHILKGHESPVETLAMTPSGQRVISGSSDRTLKVWNIESGVEIHTLNGHRNQVEAVAVTSDGSRAISGSRDLTVKLWALESGKELCTFRGHTREVNAVAASPDGNHAISASSDGTVRLWDLQSGQGLSNSSDHERRVKAVASVPDAFHAVSASMTLKIWDLETAELLCTLGKNSDDSIRAIAVTNDGKHVLAASGKRLTMWNVASGKMARVLEGHRSPIGAVALTPDGTRAVSGSIGARHIVRGGVVYGPEHINLKVWDLRSGDEIHTLEGHRGSIRAIAVTPDGNRAVSADAVSLARIGSGPAGVVKIWDLEQGREIHSLEGHKLGISALALTLDGTCVISGSSDKTLRVWNIYSGEEIHTLKGHRRPVDSVVMTPGGTDVLSGSAEFLKIWNLKSGTELCTLMGGKGAVSPDGNRVVSTAHQQVKVWDLDGMQEMTRLRVESPITACTIAPDGLTLVVGDRAGQVHFLRLKNVTPGPPVVTASRSDCGELTAQCLRCRARSGIEESDLGSIVACPDCGVDLRLNPFTADVSKRRPGGAVPTREPPPMADEPAPRERAAAVQAPAQQEEPAVTRAQARLEPVPEETPARPPLPLSFAAEQFIQSALRQHAPGERDELTLHQWLAALLDEHRGVAEAAAEGCDLDALRNALHREVEEEATPQSLTADVLVHRASERARAADQPVLRPRDLAAAILAAVIEATAGTSTQPAVHATPAEAPPLPLSFAAEQMIQAALHARDATESGQLGANEWLVALLERHREPLEDVAGARDLKDLEARARRQLSHGEVGTPLTQDTLISQASHKAEQASRQVVGPQDVATVILAASHHP